MLDTGLKFKKSGTIYMSQELLDKIVAIHRVGNLGNVEYGVYLQGTFDKANMNVMLEDEYYLPHQSVTAASIKFTEEPPAEKWNVILHRHPQGCRSFSSVDDNSINQEFLASILLLVTPVEIPKAIINVHIEGTLTKLQIDANVIITNNNTVDNSELIAMIKERVQPYVHTRPALNQVNMDDNIAAFNRRFNQQSVALSKRIGAINRNRVHPGFGDVLGNEEERGLLYDSDNLDFLDNNPDDLEDDDIGNLGDIYPSNLVIPKVN